MKSHNAVSVRLRSTVSVSIGGLRVEMNVASMILVNLVVAVVALVAVTCVTVPILVVIMPVVLLPVPAVVTGVLALRGRNVVMENAVVVIVGGVKMDQGVRCYLRRAIYTMAALQVLAIVDLPVGI